MSAYHNNTYPADTYHDSTYTTDAYDDNTYRADAYDDNTYRTNAYHDDTYPADSYQDMPSSSLNPPEDGNNEYSQESQDSTRAQFDPSEDRHGVFSLKPAPTQVQYFQRAQMNPPGQQQFDPPKDPQDDFTYMKEQPPKPPSPPPPEPTPP